MIDCKKILLLTLILVSCNEHHHEPLTTRLKEMPSLEIDDNLEQISKNRLRDFKYQEAIWNGSEKFHVLERFSEAQINKCSECHASKKTVPSFASNHDEIKLHHAPEDVMKCTTCHQEKTPWNLHMLNDKDKSVSINHPYKMCAQCHFQQVDDWSHGSHGKRVGGWYGKRVIKNCTSCHNPHAPQFPKKMPKVRPNFLKYKKLN